MCPLPELRGITALDLEVACEVCRDGLWTTSAQTSPPSSSIYASLGPARRSHLMTEGVKAKALHGPGRGSGHTSGHHTCHVSRVRTLESGGCRQKQCPLGLWSSAAQWMNTLMALG